VVDCEGCGRNTTGSSSASFAVLKALGGRRSEAVYIGDMAIDIQTGKRAGISTVAIATGSSSLRELKRQNPDSLFTDLGAFRKSLRLNPPC
jgi:phosphoglycolate phosphatase-like HAD superfamily hydrolase